MAITLKEHIARLQEIAKENPELLNKHIICSSDDEGNNFQKVHYSAGKGHFNNDREFSNGKDIEGKINCVCIN